MKSPLFSLAVVTYNSEETITETLCSIGLLSGLDTVELILTDDGSQDQTKNLIGPWLEKNQKLFHSVKTVFLSENLGISRAHTAAFAVASGKWGMYLGGDDLIVGDDFFCRLQKVLETERGMIFRTPVKEFYPESGMTYDYFESYSFMNRLSAKRQFRYLAGTGNPYRSGPGTVFDVATLKALDAFGSYNRAYEDWQLFLRFTRAGYRIGMLLVDGVLWRRHNKQFSATSYERMAQANKLVKRKEIIPYLGRLSLFERWKFRNSGRLSSRLHRIYQGYLKIWGRVFS